jgi:2-polyprenyl-3-methyl-5-hydroxy-6-metoxy-1,4-benzoquinol methylase
MSDAASIYSQAFGDDRYSRHNVSEFRYRFAIDALRAGGCRSVLDVGSGRGVFVEMCQSAGLAVTSVDCGRFHAIDVPHVIADISRAGWWTNLPNADACTCLDVMEHLDVEGANTALAGMATLAPLSVMTIANHSDRLHSRELHLIRQGSGWWHAQINRHFRSVEIVEVSPRLMTVLAEV